MLYFLAEAANSAGTYEWAVDPPTGAEVLAGASCAEAPVSASLKFVVGASPAVLPLAAGGFDRSSSGWSLPRARAANCLGTSAFSLIFGVEQLRHLASARALRRRGGQRPLVPIRRLSIPEGLVHWWGERGWEIFASSRSENMPQQRGFFCRNAARPDPAAHFESRCLLS